MCARNDGVPCYLSHGLYLGRWSLASTLFSAIELRQDLNIKCTRWKESSRSRLLTAQYCWQCALPAYDVSFLHQLLLKLRISAINVSYSAARNIFCNSPAYIILSLFLTFLPRFSLTLHCFTSLVLHHNPVQIKRTSQHFSSFIWSLKCEVPLTSSWPLFYYFFSEIFSFLLDTLAWKRNSKATLLRVRSPSANFC